jgi:UDP-glucose 4-epimerase
MNILFTGASSFTGMWFIKELVQNGHSVTALFPRPEPAYASLRLERIRQLLPLCESVFSCSFGSETFLNVIERGQFNLLCHHAADVTDYKSAAFDVGKAVYNNTRNLPKVLETLKTRGCQKILLTGSVFEQNEGEREGPDRAVSPYGLSKGLTVEIFRYSCERQGITLGKFVIPNPFGPFEEPRYTTYLAKSWLEKRIPEVACPDYLRDNIHCSLLAKIYARAADELTAQDPFRKWSPGQYRETQGAFTQRFASEMERRFSLPCPFHLKTQTEFPEPITLINTDAVDPVELHWNEAEAWDQLATFYIEHYA